MSDPVLAAVQKFMDAVETRLTAHKEEVRSMLADIETRSAPSVVEGPPGPPGEKGDPGERGADARGIAGLRITDDGALAARYSDSDEWYHVGPVVGKDGVPGERGADGVGIDHIRIHEGQLEVHMSDGEDRTLGRVVGEIGPAGERGADGLGSEAQIEALITQEVEKRFADIQVRTFADVYREVFKPGESYKRGEFVTWDGSLHLALSDTAEKPGLSKDWKLVTKRGRDR